MGLTYVILGGGCSTAIQTALYLLEKNSVDNVWAESIDGWIYTDSIGAWKQKGTPSLIKK